MQEGFVWSETLLQHYTFCRAPMRPEADTGRVGLRHTHSIGPNMLGYNETRGRHRMVWDTSITLHTHCWAPVRPEANTERVGVCNTPTALGIVWWDCHGGWHKTGGCGLGPWHSIGHSLLCNETWCQHRKSGWGVRQFHNIGHISGTPPQAWQVLQNNTQALGWL